MTGFADYGKKLFFVKQNLKIIIVPEKTFKEKILVVEDDQGEADILRMALEASRYHVDVVPWAVGVLDLDLAAYQLVIIEQCAYADCCTPGIKHRGCATFR